LSRISIDGHTLPRRPHSRPCRRSFIVRRIDFTDRPRQVYRHVTNGWHPTPVEDTLSTPILCMPSVDWESRTYSARSIGLLLQARFLVVS
jgi:hypothetical protein